jgi:ubiquinone/menaquinone biosynthesis C-methylase UbiE
VKERPPSFWELAVQATTNTRQGYNLLAPRFDLTDYATPSALIEACRNRVDRLHPINAETSYGADLACGTGRGCLLLRQSCGQVDGYDFSPGMLEVAKAKAASGPLTTGFRFVEADLATLALPAERYDRIVTFGAWGHILPAWREHVISEIVAALKPSGVFYTITADPASPSDPAWWRAAFFDAAIKARNWLLGDPFHMYYLLNDTLTVKRLFERCGPCRVRLEPVPGSPHFRLTLLMVHRSP